MSQPVKDDAVLLLLRYCESAGIKLEQKIVQKITGMAQSTVSQRVGKAKQQLAEEGRSGGASADPETPKASISKGSVNKRKPQENKNDGHEEGTPTPASKRRCSGPSKVKTESKDEAEDEDMHDDGGAEKEAKAGRKDYGLKKDGTPKAAPGRKSSGKKSNSPPKTTKKKVKADSQDTEMTDEGLADDDANHTDEADNNAAEEEAVDGDEEEVAA